MTTIHERLDELGQRIDDAAIELGFVLKAIEELSVEKGVMTRAEIQKKILELNESGWAPTVIRSNDD